MLVEISDRQRRWVPQKKELGQTFARETKNEEGEEEEGDEGEDDTVDDVEARESNRKSHLFFNSSNVYGCYLINQ